jgi:hypothetical protein
MSYGSGTEVVVLSMVRWAPSERIHVQKATAEARTSAARFR